MAGLISFKLGIPAEGTSKQLVEGRRQARFEC